MGEYWVYHLTETHILYRLHVLVGNKLVQLKTTALLKCYRVMSV